MVGRRLTLIGKEILRVRWWKWMQRWMAEVDVKRAVEVAGCRSGVLLKYVAESLKPIFQFCIRVPMVSQILAGKGTQFEAPD
jgi:hypothetical protein